MRFSFLTHLECSYCGITTGAELPQRTCVDCGKVLFARYDLKAASQVLRKVDLGTRRTDMWRYAEILPILDVQNIVSLGEGFTPMIETPRLASNIGLHELLVKDEGLNPTGSFKARGLCAAVSKAKELGISRVTIPSAGNAAGSLAAYAAAGGLEAHVFMPQDAPSANKQESLAYGAHLSLVDGFITDAGKTSAAAAQSLDLFDVSTLREPYRLEGKKTMGFEIAESLGWTLPDVIIYPTGGGTGIVGMWKAFDEMEQMGWIGTKRPRMVVVQPEGCSPIVNAFENGDEFANPVMDPHTIASGMRVPAAIGDYLILRTVRNSNGTAIRVSDNEMLIGVSDLARLAGIFAAPEGGATVAGLRKLIQSGEIDHGERVLILNTGSALKYLDVLGRSRSQGS